MPLAIIESSTHVHTRQITMRGFRADQDGVWFIEGSLKDTKAVAWMSPEQGLFPPETPVHDISARLRLDSQFTVLGIEVAMDSVPFGECHGALGNAQQLVGHRVASGWRKAIDACLGATAGCTHMRELLLQMGAVAFQTMSGARRHVSVSDLQAPLQPPAHLGKCVSLDFDGRPVRMHWPRYSGWRSDT